MSANSSDAVRVVGLGAGGHAAVVIEAVRACGTFEIVGVTDPRTDLWGSTVFGVPVLGGDDELAHQYHQGVSHAFIGLGGASDTSARRRLFELVRGQGFELVTIVHPTALFSPSARAGSGAMLLAHAVVNANAVLGNNVLVNTGAIVEHNSEIGSHAHIAVGATLASSVRVGDGAHIGAGATVLEGRSIGARAVVGAGAVVTRDVDPATVVAGVPARRLHGANE